MLHETAPGRSAMARRFTSGKWALEQSAYRSRVGRRGRLPADITEAYYTAFPDERPA